jgi:hypothetical protein
MNLFGAIVGESDEAMEGITLQLGLGKVDCSERSNERKRGGVKQWKVGSE